jgi:hypothetical protein
MLALCYFFGWVPMWGLLLRNAPVAACCVVFAAAHAARQYTAAANITASGVEEAAATSSKTLVPAWACCFFCGYLLAMSG